MKSLTIYSFVFFLYKKRLLSNIKSRIVEFPKVNKTIIKQNKVWTQTNDQFKRQNATTLISLKSRKSFKERGIRNWYIHTSKLLNPSKWLYTVQQNNWRQSCIQTCFGAIWRIWMYKKMCPENFFQHFFILCKK